MVPYPLIGNKHRAAAVNQAAPPLIGEHALTYDPVAGRVALYGGNAAGWPYENATREFDGAWLTVTTALVL